MSFLSRLVSFFGLVLLAHAYVSFYPPSMGSTALQSSQRDPLLTASPMQRLLRTRTHRPLQQRPRFRLRPATGHHRRNPPRGACGLRGACSGRREVEAD